MQEQSNPAPLSTKDFFITNGNQWISINVTYNYESSRMGTCDDENRNLQSYEATSGDCGRT